MHPYESAADYDAKYPTAREDTAYHAGHAAGYAAAVADVVAWLRSYAEPHWPSVDIGPALLAIKQGAHVGAAKKGAT